MTASLNITNKVKEWLRYDANINGSYATLDAQGNLVYNLIEGGPKTTVLTTTREMRFLMKTVLVNNILRVTAVSEYINQSLCS